MIQIAQRLLLVGREALHKRGIVELRLTRRGSQIAQHAKTPKKQLAPFNGHGLPARQKAVANILPLLRRKALEESLAVLNGVLLFRAQPVPLLEIPADLRLTLRRQALEALVVLHEPLLLFRRAIAELFNPFRRKPFHTANVGLALLRAGLLSRGCARAASRATLRVGVFRVGILRVVGRDVLRIRVRRGSVPGFAIRLALRGCAERLGSAALRASQWRIEREQRCQAHHAKLKTAKTHLDMTVLILALILLRLRLALLRHGQFGERVEILDHVVILENVEILDQAEVLFTLRRGR